MTRSAAGPVPSLRSGHVLVRAVASSVNAADVLVRSGGVRLLSGRSFPRGSGFDFVGDVVAAAELVGGRLVLTSYDGLLATLDPATGRSLG